MNIYSVILIVTILQLCCCGGVEEANKFTSVNITTKETNIDSALAFGGTVIPMEDLVSKSYKMLDTSVMPVAIPDELKKLVPAKPPETPPPPSDVKEFSGSPLRWAPYSDVIVADSIEHILGI